MNGKAKHAPAGKVNAKPGTPATPAKPGPSKPAAMTRPVSGSKPAPVAKSHSASKPAASPAPAVDPKKVARKGITIVTPKPAKKPKPKPTSVVPPGMGQLFSAGGPARKPLIPSGPNAKPLVPLGSQLDDGDKPRSAIKSPFAKKDLLKFRTILFRKRAELIGDVSMMESEALKGESGSLSNLPQHIAEQGSEAYEQALSLDLAAADRKLIKEIDDAIKRIDDGTYGICELTGKPIKAERLEELPWARYSIEAARELERRSMRA
ncbi:MAG: TraR/DksA C4-type zinc finger protein [Phycisphaerales bacterium]|nr:TraR/DksA C4-type zinc finger protein [Phycisphaerales bacterium]